MIRGVRMPFLLKNVLLIESSSLNIFSEGATRVKRLGFKFTEDNVFDYIAGVAPNGEVTNARWSKFAMSMHLDKRPAEQQCLNSDEKRERTIWKAIEI